ncbi:hypothetical protein SLS62_009528 [Diatrype stigma]|uniref:Uncharacterized protein n=1 Tax=Diatrype stigma TaxID=117547 RepID=A0AAN9YKF0_9PEZI
MTTAPPSPKRRHILSSINPERPPITEERSETLEPTAPPREPSLHYDADRNGVMERPPEQQPQPRKTSKFRFKSKNSSSHRSSRHRNKDRDRNEGRDPNLADDGGDGNQEHDSSSTQRRHRRHRRHHDDHGYDDQQARPADDKDDSSRHHHHHRHKRRRHHRHRTPTRSPTPPNPYDPAPLSPDAAFRASLFDAMADDEGAAYWEGVYGQPMHVYSRGSGGSGEAPAGELEQMDEEEYAAYVRQRMWEKTHEGLLEERARREARKQQRAARETEARRLTREMEESLRRGEERRRRKGWRERWEAYVAAWAAWENNSNNNDKTNTNDDNDDYDNGRHPLENDTDMAWPVESGRRADVRDGEDGNKTDAVREFFVRGLVEAQEDAAGETDNSVTTAVARLKDERVRWHPDKVQQRLGGRVDDGLLRDVTAVFQAVDKLWSDMRAKKEA